MGRALCAELDCPVETFLGPSKVPSKVPSKHARGDVVLLVERLELLAPFGTSTAVREKMPMARCFTS